MMFMLTLFTVLLLIRTSLSLKSKLTLDDFFNYTEYSSLTLAPNDGQSILIQSKHHIWDRNVNEQHLHLQDLTGNNKQLITTKASSSFKPLWHDEWIAYISEIDSTSDMKSDNLSAKQVHYIHLYLTRTKQTFVLPIGVEPVHVFSWSNKNTTLYFATRTPWTNEAENAYKSEWNNVIQYREQERGDTIYRLDIENTTSYKIEILTNISLRVEEMICSPDGRQLVFSTGSRSQRMESIEEHEIYSFDLMNHSTSIPLKLTNNKACERKLKWFTNQSILFLVFGEGSIEGDYQDRQGQLYSMNLMTGQIQRWAEQFQGHIEDFALLEQGRAGVIILGQSSIEIQIYTQQSTDAELKKQTGWNGSYESIVTISGGNSSTIAFIHSSFDAPQEVYFVNDVSQLSAAQLITRENQLFTERNLPKGKSYRWLNEDDQKEIEGVLLYPPDKFEQTNLPLLVLIHGGPYGADLNIFHADWYYCAGMMATEDWLVLQPNYRGSTGYGDEFLKSVLLEMLSRPGKDILFGVNALIRDGIADPTRLAIGGYSYGGYLTNWLITQTTRFNAALTGAGAVENVADWGTTDEPILNAYFLGGFPWGQPKRYQEEAAVYKLDKVCTPTHIVTGENDIRVSTAQNYILERALHTLGVPTKLIVFPGVGHVIENNPWHEKIKVREEIKWLHKYGNTRPQKCHQPSNPSIKNQCARDFTSIFIMSLLSIVVLMIFNNK